MQPYSKKFIELRDWATRFSPALFDDLFQRKINVDGTVHHDRRGMLQGIGPKALKMKWGDIVTYIRRNLRAVCWKDKHDVYVLMNMHNPPNEGNFIDGCGHAIKPHVTEDYNAHMESVDKADRMVKSYGIAQRPWNCSSTKKTWSVSVHSLFTSKVVVR
jgi:hypothetical protein